MKSKKKPLLRRSRDNLYKYLEEFGNVEYQFKESYISNPDSLYYYRGKNIFKSIGKLALHIDHKFTNMPDDLEAHKETIVFNKEIARQKKN